MKSLWAALVQQGTAANRPTTPDVPGADGVGAFYYATDTSVLSVYANGAWATITQSGETVQTGVTASTTQTRAGATQLTGTYANVSTVANASDAVGLPDIAFVGQHIIVTNSGANAMKVFPSSAANGANTQIDGGTAGTGSVTITNAKSARFVALTATTWQSIGNSARAA